MKNLLPSGLEINHKFDLKGSTYGRKASKKEREKAHPTFKVSLAGRVSFFNSFLTELPVFNSNATLPAVVYTGRSIWNLNKAKYQSSRVPVGASKGTRSTYSTVPTVP